MCSKVRPAGEKGGQTHIHLLAPHATDPCPDRARPARHSRQSHAWRDRATGSSLMGPRAPRAVEMVDARVRTFIWMFSETARHRRCGLGDGAGHTCGLIPGREIPNLTRLPPIVDHDHRSPDAGAHPGARREAPLLRPFAGNRAWAKRVRAGACLADTGQAQTDPLSLPSTWLVAARRREDFPDRAAWNSGSRGKSASRTRGPGHPLHVLG